MLSQIVHKIKYRLFYAIESLNLRLSRVSKEPFLSPDEFDWVAEVEAATPDIVRELREVQRQRQIPAFQEVSRDQEFLTQDQRWKTFFLYGYGRRVADNCAACPATEAALKKIPGMTTAMFSILAPGKKIPPHRGPYNGVLRYHLGLVVPESADQCGIRVGKESRHWAAGESLIFDDTFDHEAWNKSEEERTVLFVDFNRPLRFPANLINSLVVWFISRSQFVTEAMENLRRFDGTR